MGSVLPTELRASAQAARLQNAIIHQGLPVSGCWLDTESQPANLRQINAVTGPI
jgi:hypothetical protein